MSRPSILRDIPRGSSRSVTSGRRSTRCVSNAFALIVLSHSTDFRSIGSRGQVPCIQSRARRARREHGRPLICSHLRSWRPTTTRLRILSTSPPSAQILKIKSFLHIVLSIAFNNQTLHGQSIYISCVPQLRLVCTGAACKVDAKVSALVSWLETQRALRSRKIPWSVLGETACR